MNNSSLSFTFSIIRMKTPVTSVFFRPPVDQASQGLFSYLEIWIFIPIFHLKDRSEDVDRHSTLSFLAADQCAVALRVFANFLFWFPNLHYMKLVCRNKYASVRRSAASHESVTYCLVMKLFKPRINRTFCSSVGLHRISFVSCFEESFRTVFIRCSKSSKCKEVGYVSPGCTDLSASRAARPRSASPLRLAPSHAPFARCLAGL